ncbi:F-box domain-containing protein [Heracleum sosnowskyi]|uniref:F-box domain-containing protein n=1 Tax=Heracleum sosnowskyi TaxID=360622 RepID=A0AAD8MIC9_9APIA|nr:F-box domain-containing protein [Heracleum sosnowskyi]
MDPERLGISTCIVITIVEQKSYTSARLKEALSWLYICSISVLSFDKEDRDRSFTEHMLVESTLGDQFELRFSYVKHVNPIASQFVVIGTCNGLFCVDLRAPDERCASFLLLWNPVTKQNRFLPKPQIDASPKGVNFVLAFGFEPESSDYKVVRIVYYHSAENSSVMSDKDDVFVMQIEVYKMSTDSWTTFQENTLLCSAVSNVSLEEEPVLPLEIRKSSPVFLKGAFHWLAIDPRNHDDGQSAIVLFDLKDEQLRLMTVLDSCRQGGKLVLINDLLSHIVSHQPRDGVAYDIWVMNSYGVKESWTKQFTVKESLGTLWPLGYWKDDLLLMVEIILGKRNLFFYNLYTGATKSLPYLEKFSFLGFCRYVETLVPVT